MKLTTIRSFFGQTVTVNGEEVKFDHTGVCEINNKLGTAAIEKYPEFIFSNENKVKHVETVQEEINQDLVNRLSGEIFDLKKQLEAVKEEKKGTEADLKEWQSKVAEYVEKSDKFEKAYIQQKESHDNQVQALELRITLMNTSSNELKKLCEDSGYDKKEWELLTKEKLIEYILNK